VVPFHYLPQAMKVNGLYTKEHRKSSLANPFSLWYNIWVIASAASGFMLGKAKNPSPLWRHSS
jgi:hypothetical protein